MSILSKRVSRIQPSPTLSVTFLAQKLKAEGREVINLGVGEPDFDTPEFVKEAAIEAIRRGETKYPPVSGTAELKSAVIYKLKHENDIEYEKDQILISNGGKHSLFNLFLATIDPGDQVIIPVPYWVSYPDMVLLAEGTPVFVECSVEHNFKLTPNVLEKAITSKTKWVILNSPNNPTGACYSAQEIRLLCDVVAKYNHVHIVSDEIYEHMTYGNHSHHSVPAIAKELFDRIVVVNGLSKAFAMTGWRVGFAAGPKEIIQGMSKLQSQSTSGVCSIAQAASAKALLGPNDFMKERRERFKERRDLLVHRLKAIKGLTCNEPEGAFYVFPGCKKLVGKVTKEGNVIKDGTDLAAYLLDSVGVAVVPGIAFGLHHYFRISYAVGYKKLEKASDLMEEAINTLV